jgi:hypothetical protein
MSPPLRLGVAGIAVFTIIEFVSKKDCDVSDNIVPDWVFKSLG